MLAYEVVHEQSNKTVMGMLSTKEPHEKEMSSHATHQGVLVYSHLSSLSRHWLILGLKEWTLCTQADLLFKVQAWNGSLNLIPTKSLHMRESHHHSKHRWSTSICTALLYMKNTHSFSSEPGAATSEGQVLPNFLRWWWAQFEGQV